MAQDLGQVLAGVEHALSLTELAHHLPGRVALPLHCGHPPLVGLDSHSRWTAIRRPVWRYKNDRSRARSCLVDQGIGTCPNGGSVRFARDEYRSLTVRQFIRSHEARTMFYVQGGQLSVAVQRKDRPVRCIAATSPAGRGPSQKIDELLQAHISRSRVYQIGPSGSSGQVNGKGVPGEWFPRLPERHPGRRAPR